MDVVHALARAVLAALLLVVVCPAQGQSSATLNVSARSVSGGTGSVTSADTAPAIGCGVGSTSGCSGVVNWSAPATSATVVLTANPTTGSKLSSWTGCTTPSGDTCTVVMSALRTVTATFAPATFGLTVRAVNAAGTGRVTAPSTPAAVDCSTPSTCTSAVANGQEVTLTATPVGDSSFIGWSGACTGKLPTCAVKMTAARTVTATFGPGSYPVSVAFMGGSGSVTSSGDIAPSVNCATPGTGTCTGRVPLGRTAKLIASPDAMSDFMGWSGCSSVLGTECTIASPTAARVLTASFRAKGCHACHGVPPAAPHAQSMECTTCHVGFTYSTANGNLHLNGVIDILASVGGVVTGLMGDGLLLALNGADTIAVVGSGPFAFGTKVATGSPYSVTVAQQPAGQVCTVAGAAGVVGSANVLSVAVTCVDSAPPSFAVGGTVTDLAGSGLTLASPGQPNLEVAAGATTFTFANLVASGTAYAVTVLQQPGDPAQVCEVLNGSGTVASAHVTSVAVSCRSAWWKVAAGGYHAVGIRPDGTLWAWGDNAGGQVGNGALGTHVVSPVQVGSGFSSVAAGDLHTVAVKTDGTLWAWGNNAYGQLGNGTSGTTVAAPVQVGIGFSSVAAGAFHTVAVKIDGTLWAWGMNREGQIGAGISGTNVVSPVQVGTGFSSVAAGAFHTIAVKTDGTLWAWGNNYYGQVGNGTSGRNVLSPVQVGISVSSASAGSYHTVAVKLDGTLWAWGNNNYGQVGSGIWGSEVLSPVQVETGVGSVAAGGYHTVTIKTDGTLWAWGSNGAGQLGNGTFGSSVRSPVQVGTDFRSVAAGAHHTVAVKTSGTLWAWGSSYQGQVGSGALGTNVLSPLMAGRAFASIAAGAYHTVAVNTDGTLWAWGNNESGQIGNGASGTDVVSPVQVGTGFSSVAAGAFHTVAVKTDGTLWAWGDNGEGQIGNGTWGSIVASPVLVGSGFSSVAAGGYHTLAVKTDGTLWAWGGNSYGQIGAVDPFQTFQPSPVQVVQLGTSVSSVAAGVYHAVAVKTDGTLWAWGANYAGQIGNGTLGLRVPAPEPVGAGFSSVAAGGEHTVAVMSDGSLWAWGNNSDGQIGNGTSGTNVLSPVQVGSGFSSVAAGAYHTVAVKPDATLWAWGRNDYGQLGTGTSGTAVLSPVQMGAAYGSVAAGAYHTVGIRTDATLWAWGSTNSGQVACQVVIPFPIP